MLSCLQNTVKLLELCDTREDGEYYINDIPYLSEQAFAYLRNAEKDTAQKVFDSVERSALAAMRSDLYFKARQKIKLVKQSRTVVSSEWASSKDALTASNKLKGWYLDLSDSPYQEVSLTGFELRAAGALTDESLYIFDLYSGQLLEEISFDLAAGHNTVTFEKPKSYSSRLGLFIAYDANNIASWENSKYGYLNGNRIPCPCGQLSGSYEIDISGDPATMTIFKDSLDSLNYNGLNIKYRISCSYDLLFCDHSDLLIEALRHKMALVYFQQGQAVGAFASPVNMIEADTLEDIKAHLKDTYNQQINTFFQLVKADSFCFRCSSPVEVVRLTP